MTTISFSVVWCAFTASILISCNCDETLSQLKVTSGDGSHVLNDLDLTGIPQKRGEEFKNDTQEFPPDLFSLSALQHGAIILHFFGAFYSFAVIGIICGDYFLPAVDCICSDLYLSQDVAAATFMAFATTAPELFITLISTFLSPSDAGLGAIVGCGMFNMLGVATVGGLAAKTSIKLDWWPLLRDSTVYMISVGHLALVIADGIVTLFESITLIVYYFVYFFVMFWSRKIEKKIKACMKAAERKLRNKKITDNQVPVLPTISLELNNSEIKDEKEGKTLSLNNQKETEEDEKENDDSDTMFKAYFMHYEDCISLRRLSIASKGSASDRRRSVRSLKERKLSNTNQKQGSHLALPNENKMVTTLKPPEVIEIKNSDEPPENEENEPIENEEEELEEQTFKTIFCTFPVDSIWSKISWLLLWPISLILYFTIPDARTKRWKKFYPISFIMCFIWIGLNSYFASWMISEIGFVLGIPESVMGLTFLAIGGSMPEVISTYIMASQGEGKLGFSNSLGGNIMDICLCLGLPWLLNNIFTGMVEISSEGLMYNILALSTGAIILISTTIFTKFHMNRVMDSTPLMIPPAQEVAKRLGKTNLLTRLYSQNFNTNKPKVMFKKEKIKVKRTVHFKNGQS